MQDPHHLEQLRAEARYHRQRHALYRAKRYGPRETSAARLRELERLALAAEQRLRDAERRRGPADPPA